MTTQDKFNAAVEIINSLPRNGTFQPSDDLLIKLYAYQKQATDGPCITPKPSIWDMSSRNKWNAWNDLGNMPKETAMEKYIEELKKVIETMSYNEKVSKFMSLIGPFYEVVSADEIDIQVENKVKHTEYSFPTKVLESLQSSKTDPTYLSTPLKYSVEKQDYNLSNSLSTSCSSMPQRVPCSNLISGENKTLTEKNAFDFLKMNTQKSSLFYSQKDFLILALINAQSSLEEILKKFDRLQALAKTANFQINQSSENPSPCEDWNLSYAGTAFALLWPLAVHLFFKDL